MLVKTTYINYPKETLRVKQFMELRQWNVVTGSSDEVNMMAVQFKDLKEKQFIASCFTILEGKPQATKHHGNVLRPNVAELYLKIAARVEKYNHIQIGSSGLDDPWQTKVYIHRHFAGIMAFIFTNSYFGIKYFSRDYRTKDVRGVVGIHTAFKIKLAN